MSEVNSEDINRLHERIDQVVEITTEIRVHQAKMEERLDNIVIPEQPCEFIKEHLKEHKRNFGFWQSNIVRTVFDLLKLGIVAILTYIFTKNQLSS